MIKKIDKGEGLFLNIVRDKINEIIDWTDSHKDEHAVETREKMKEMTVSQEKVTFLEKAALEVFEGIVKEEELEEEEEEE